MMTFISQSIVARSLRLFRQNTAWERSSVDRAVIHELHTRSRAAMQRSRSPGVFAALASPPLFDMPAQFPGDRTKRDSAPGTMLPRSLLEAAPWSKLKHLI